MARYLVLYNSSLNANELMASATPEEMKASMDEWVVWKEEADKTVKVDWGLPMQAICNVTPAGNSDSHNPASGHSFIDADTRETALAVLKDHPHLKRDGASIDVFELLSMPGM